CSSSGSSSAVACLRRPTRTCRTRRANEPLRRSRPAHRRPAGPGLSVVWRRPHGVLGTLSSKCTPTVLWSPICGLHHRTRWHPLAICRGPAPQRADDPPPCSAIAPLANSLSLISRSPAGSNQPASAVDPPLASTTFALLGRGTDTR